MVNRAAGPSTSSAATATASFAVEAGAKPAPAWRESSTWPVDRSATSAPTCAPSAPEPSPPASAAATPAGVAAGPERPSRGVAPPAALVAGTGSSTGPASVTPRLATVGSRHSASRAGSMRATVTPAAIVNTMIRASEAIAATRSRGNGSPPFGNCWSPLGAAGPGPGRHRGNGVNHLRAGRRESWNSM